MKEITLESQEYKEIATIVEKYRDIDSNLSKVQESLEKLESEKNLLLSKLDSVREDENKLFSEIEKKYGRGKLDVTTFKYIVM